CAQLPRVECHSSRQREASRCTDRKRPECPPSALLAEKKEGHVKFRDFQIMSRQTPGEASIIPSNLEGLAVYARTPR
ncbi:hypothetical protein ACQP3L_34075, partial [Escherichia coli]